MADFCIEVYTPEYASGFAILGAEGYESTVMNISSPWQGAYNENKTIFIRRRNESVPKDFKGTVIDGDVSRIVCMSSSHIAMLSAIDAESLIAGVSGKRFIYSDALDKAVDIGYDEYTDYEMILSLDTDIALIYGITGASQIENRLAELNIPFAYIGDYLEDSPLGKSEWIVAIAEIIGKRDVGEKAFCEIARRYNYVRERIRQDSQTKTKVMLNAPYGDIWFMPGNKSYMTRLIEDAGGQCVYRKNDTNRSLPIDIEEAVTLASQADVWLNAEAESISDLCSRCHNCSDVRCVTNRRVYNCDKRKSPGGGNDFWESGIINPDVIIRDLSNIFQNKSADSLYYYRQLR